MERHKVFDVQRKGWMGIKGARGSRKDQISVPSSDLAWGFCH
jgi:hypothetical protein